MKKITTLFTAALLLVASLSFAKDPNPVPQGIAKAFTTDFENATGVEWKEIDAYYKASFRVNGQTIGAFYNGVGELVATPRKLSVEGLPMSLQKELKRLAPVYQEEDLFELLSQNGTEYFVQFFDGKETKSYKSDGESWMRI